ncbi:MAG: peroxiredoxin [Gammaproteobacteria bacterium]|jgi:peroxiredoxin Q/BCP|nr:peroxiredoxin [Gammaproteobacteria bacterium]NBR16560.1 peroxiredoxin [Gammaproteobacteria bacterium]NCW22015.1 peroxiredoxin [Gammaproteobacteria bacterium]NCW57952.1 peroxiredoxin [Gammaproteobacteria bacterium]NDA43906.1 peroxiredoxin [Gammaproteobacteria bacterium]
MPKATQIAPGKKVPDFSATTTDGGTWRLRDAKGSKVVLFFYPKDMTSGCTVEAQQFRDLQSAFRKATTMVIGVSRDSCASHQKFKTKEKLNYELLSDADEALCQLFDVIKEKNMYGKKVMGIERSTFLIDADGKLAQEWRKVKADGHAAEVLLAAKAL